MADVRALLRQQRESRRIEHPHAAYSDAGKLLCTVCHEHIKTEALWDGHLRSVGHRQKLQLKTSTAAKENGHSGDGNTHNDARNGGGTKRKLDEDVDMDDVDEQDAAREDNVRKKRSKPDMTLGELTPSKREDNKTSAANNHKPITPPLTRRQSGTPTLGVEMQIPSRPATPGGMPQSAGGSSAGGSTSTATTPKTAGPFARSPLIQHDSSSFSAAQSAGSQIPTFRPPAAAPLTTASAAPSNIPTVTEVNEDEWAAFEAELVHGEATASAAKVSASAKAILESSAAISAPALSAEEIAAKSTDEEQTSRRAAADIEIEHEREEATRALETEFEVMEELEARAKRLRDRREALRLRGGKGADAAAPSSGGGESGSGVDVAVGKAAVAAAVSLGKENAPEEEEDDEEDEDETDDWVGFRFRS
ncbi:hypothetical protein V8F33_004180 [Rhypophila sp. PSN 637]